MKHRIFALVLASAILSGCAAQTPLPDLYPWQKQIRSLGKERVDLRQQIADQQDALRPDPVCVLCFDGAYSSVYETAFPLLESAGFPAVVITTADTLPGENGMMNADQANSLIAAGWEFVPSVVADLPTRLDGAPNPAWIAELDQTLTAMRELGLPASTCIAFAPDCYDPLLDQALVDRGFSAALHRWSNDLRTEKLAEYQLEFYGGTISDGNSVYRVGGATICAGNSSAQLDVQIACQERTVIAVCTGQVKQSVPAADQDTDCTTEKYLMMIEDVTEYGEDFGIRVLTFSGAYRYKWEFESELVDRRSYFDAFRQQTLARIAEIDREISALMGQGLDDEARSRRSA